MDVIGNSARTALERGDLALGIGIRVARTVEMARAMRNAGFDWLFLDMEHSALDLDPISQLSVVALEVGIAPIVRIPPGEYTLGTRALDNGAQGVIVPHVDSVEDAREMVARFRYPPAGHRSIGGTGAVLGFRPDRIAASMADVDRATLLVAMLETPGAIERADAIAAVPGVDVLLVGTNDLCAELGVPGAFESPAVAAAYGAVIAACKRHGKWPGMAGMPTETLMRRYIQSGVRFVMAGSDFPLLMAGARSRAAALRST